ncbi:MAG TPA: DUF4388 domain-containing protein [Pyrinomonadaceae bacterium]
MSEVGNTHGILDIIKSIASNRESGRLEINSSGTHGALLFGDGKLMYARLGSLEGFQAVNAAVSLRDAEFNFVHATYPPHSGSISPSERIVLSQFFGIEAAEVDGSHSNPDTEIDWNMMPEQVVPLAEVEEMRADDLQDTPTIEARPVAAPTNVHAFTFQRARIALYLALILVVTAVVAIALRSRLKARQQVASATTSVESTSQPVPEPSIAEVKQSNPQPRDESEQREVDAQDLAGEWKVINTVEKTRYQSFDRMQVGFRLKIKQTGKDFTATGEKFSENGRTLPQNNRTPIRVTGSIDGDKIVATFVEDGLTRRTNGRFLWKLQSDGSALTGTFVSTAANSSGKSAATKQQ